MLARQTQPRLLMAMTIAVCSAVLAHADLATLARLAVSEDAAQAQGAIRQLRQAGPRAIDALSAAHADALARWDADQVDPAEMCGGDWARLRAAFDRVGGACDNHAARLYWYTDLDQARAAAQASGRLILSLRLLGNLDEEFSCATSRYFRTTLYSDPRVADLLRQQFVLHWKSVRPVPRITIDFGDGRRIERTITGHSVHYVLDAQGRPVDALPGLYTPQTFVHNLGLISQVFGSSSAQEWEHRGDAIHRWHSRQARGLDARWVRASGEYLTATTVGDDGQPVPANIAAPVALTKAGVEVPLLKGMGMPVDMSAVDSETLRRMALAQREEGGLAPAVRRVMAEKLGRPVPEAMLAAFEDSVARETIQSDFFHRRAVHQWFLEAPPQDADELNERVYAELFRTPSSDPWLGLVPADVFSGLPGDGLVLSATGDSGTK